MSRILLLFSLLPFLFSCDSLRNEVDPDRLNRESGKLVITGFVSPQDTVLAVQINRSIPVLGQAGQLRDVANASVTLSNGSRLVSLRFTSNYKQQGINLYWASPRDFPISAGQTYTLTVTTPEGESATSQCTIPGEAPSFEMQFDSAVVNNGYYYINGSSFPVYGKEYSLRTQWLDLIGGRNYYRTAAVLRTEATVPMNATLTQVSYRNTFFDNTGLQTDGPDTDGRKLTSSEGVYYQYSNNPYNGSNLISGPSGTTSIACPTCATIISGPTGTTTINPPAGTNPFATSADDAEKFRFGSNLRSAVLTVSLLHTDENYYRYHDAVTRQQDSDGNPFAEPVQIPSNISGGLGCFAGYNKRTVVVRLK